MGKYRTCSRQGVKNIMKNCWPLCGFCDHIETCPRFAAHDIPEMDDYITEFQELSEKEMKYKDKVATQKKICS